MAYVEIIDCDDDTASVIVAHETAGTVTWSMLRDLNRAELNALMADLRAAAACGERLDDVVAAWAAMSEL